jgi:hypothetical protein
MKCFLVLGVDNSPVAIDSINTCRFVIVRLQVVFFWHNLVFDRFMKILVDFVDLVIAIRRSSLSYVNISRAWAGSYASERILGNEFELILCLLTQIPIKNLILSERILLAICWLDYSVLRTWKVEISTRISTLTTFLDQQWIDLGLEFRLRKLNPLILW